MRTFAPAHIFDNFILRVVLQIPPLLLTLLRMRPTLMTLEPHSSAQFLTTPLKHDFREEAMRNTKYFRLKVDSVAMKDAARGSRPGLKTKD